MQLVVKNYSNKDSVVLAQGQTNRPMEQNRGTIKDPHIHGNTMVSLQLSEERMIFLINAARAIRLPYGEKKKNPSPSPYHTHTQK